MFLLPGILFPDAVLLFYNGADMGGFFISVGVPVVEFPRNVRTSIKNMLVTGFSVSAGDEIRVNLPFAAL